MTSSEYERLIELLDGRIDRLTKPIPSQQILRFAEGIRSANIGDDDSVGTYGEDDYSNLLHVQEIINELLPPILEAIRAHSISAVSGWRFEAVTSLLGDRGLCAICRSPFLHLQYSTKVHCIDMIGNSYSGVCRECVRQYAPSEFISLEYVRVWIARNPGVCEAKEADQKTEELRIDFLDAVHRHGHSTHYFEKIMSKASEWTRECKSELR